MTEEEKLAEITWLREYSNGRKELKEIALKNGSLPDYASFDLEFWKRIYVEGKQAGAKTQWHDLRENPDDFPEEEGDYLIYTKDFGIEIRNYFADTKSFSCRPSKMVIAWCEIPKFEEMED